MRRLRIARVISLALAACGEPVGAADDTAATPDAGVMPLDARLVDEPDAANVVPPPDDASLEPDASAPLAPLFLDGFFPIAADYQQPDSFARWQARGVNTMIRVPHRRGAAEWTREANRLGLRMIREPREPIEEDLDEPSLIAWSGQDEPELHRVPASTIADFRERLRRADPDRPFFINFWGGAVLDRGDPYCNGPGDGSGEGCYPRYIEIADWVGADIYPVNRYDANLALIGRLVDKLERWSAPRPVMPYIEVSDWDGDGIGPSARQVRAQMWHAIVHGARGLLYFAVRLRPDRSCCVSYDATPTSVADMMARQHARITALAPVLQGPIEPDGVTVEVEPPLEATWRTAADGAYIIVLNFSNEAHAGGRMRIAGTAVSEATSVDVVGEDRVAPALVDGALVDDFGAYEARVYRIW